MLKNTYNISRQVSSVEFWHLLPNNKERAESIEKELTENGSLISCENTISEDGLLFTRTSIFKDLDSLHQMKEDAVYIYYEQDRIAYNIANSHIFYSSNEEI
jgi:hypothetical protein